MAQTRFGSTFRNPRYAGPEAPPRLRPDLPRVTSRRSAEPLWSTALRTPVHALHCPFSDRKGIASIPEIGGLRDGSRPEVDTNAPEGSSVGGLREAHGPDPGRLRLTLGRLRGPVTAERKSKYPSTRRGSRQGENPAGTGMPMRLHRLKQCASMPARRGSALSGRSAFPEFIEARPMPSSFGASLLIARSTLVD